MAAAGGFRICRYRHWEIGPLIPHGGLIFCQKASTQLNNPYFYIFTCSFSWTVCTECNIRCPAWPATFSEIRPPHYGQSFDAILTGFPENACTTIIQSRGCTYPCAVFPPAALENVLLLKELKKIPLEKLIIACRYFFVWSRRGQFNRLCNTTKNKIALKEVSCWVTTLLPEPIRSQ